MATMKDVADRAGVSLSTVSYVLSGTRSISEATRATILQAMEELDYHPNAVARALASKRTRVVALLLSPEERGLGLSELEFVRGAAAAARTLGHHLVLLTEGMDSAADVEYLKHQGLVDGVILMEVRLRDPRVALLQRLGLPFSLLGSPDPALNLPSVDIDFEESFRVTLEHLHGLGHRRVSFINQSREAWKAGYGPVVRAQTAFEHWGASLGFEMSTAYSHPTPRDGWSAVEELLGVPRPPTALVVMNDRALPGVLQALAARGLRVPEAVSVVSAVTSSLAAEMMMPALTSANAPSWELARLAVENLVKTLDEPRTPLGNALIPCRLTPRASTGPAPHHL